MQKAQYNLLITEAVRLQKLVKRHNKNIKDIEADLVQAMNHDKLDVFQGEAGTITYRHNVTNSSSYDLFKLFKKLKITLFLKLVVFNATLAKALVKSGKVDSKIIDAVKTVATKTTPARLKIQPL